MLARHALVQGAQAPRLRGVPSLPSLAVLARFQHHRQARQTSLRWGEAIAVAKALQQRNHHHHHRCRHHRYCCCCCWQRQQQPTPGPLPPLLHALRALRLQFVPTLLETSVPSSPPRLARLQLYLRQSSRQPPVWLHAFREQVLRHSFSVLRVLALALAPV